MKRDDGRAVPTARRVSMGCSRGECSNRMDELPSEAHLGRKIIRVPGEDRSRSSPSITGAGQTSCNGHGATYPSAVVSHRSSFGSSTSFRLGGSAPELRTITSGRVDDGALMTSRSVLMARLCQSSVVVDELPSPAPPAGPPPALPAGATPVPGTLALRLDRALDIDVDMSSTGKRGVPIDKNSMLNQR